MDKTRDAALFATAMTALAAAFGREADKAFFAAYEIGLQDLPIDAIERGVAVCIKTSRFMPTVAELRERAGVVSPRERAVIAWEAFRQALKSHGYYDTVQFDDPVTTATVRNLGGWERVSEVRDNREQFEVFLRKEFERVYVALCGSGVTPYQAQPLPGFFDRMNLPAGHEPQDVKRIETGLPELPNMPALPPAVETPPKRITSVCVLRTVPND